MKGMGSGSGSPLLEPFRRRRATASGLSQSPVVGSSGRTLPDSPVRPRALAPLFTNVAVDGASPRTPIYCEQNPSPDNSSKHSSDPKKSSPHMVDHLVPKNVARLAALGGGREALVKMVDPQPNWTLEDLRTELETLAGKLSASNMQEGNGAADEVTQMKENSPPPRQRWAFDEEVADFNRSSKPFIMRLDDDEDDEEDDEETENDVADNEAAPVCSNQKEQDSQSKTDRESTMGNCTSRFLAHEVFLTTTSKVEAALFEADRSRLLRVQEELRQKRSQLESALLEESQRSTERIAQVVKDEEARCEMMRRSDKQYQRLVAEQRDKHLSALQRDHEQRSQVEERKIKKEEEAQRRELAAREELERQLKAKAEAEAAAKLAEAERVKRMESQKVEAEKKRQAEAAARAEAEKREAERKEKESAELASQRRPQGEPQPRVAKSAEEHELSRKKLFHELEQASQSLLTNQKNIKTLGFQIAKILNQVTATEEQVRKKSMELQQLLNNPQIHTYVVTTLASKLMSQCETQVARVSSYAFVFARIIVNVSNQIPVVMDAVIAQLNSSCILTVPKYYVYKKSDYESDKSYYKFLGFREDDSGKLETADDYVARMNAYVTLYAAITQTEGANRHGIANAWQWYARLLNHLPANRYTASALHAFLETAGFRLHQTYPRPFMKLLQAIVTKFVPLLQKHNDPDARAVLNRLETYLATRQFTNRPNDQLTQQTYSTIVMRES